MTYCSYAPIYSYTTFITAILIICQATIILLAGCEYRITYLQISPRREAGLISIQIQLTTLWRSLPYLSPVFTCPRQPRIRSSPAASYSLIPGIRRRPTKTCDTKITMSLTDYHFRIFRDSHGPLTITAENVISGNIIFANLDLFAEMQLKCIKCIRRSLFFGLGYSSVGFSTQPGTSVHYCAAP